MEMELIKCPLNKYTFSIKPIREWVEHECEGKVLNLFAGQTKLNVDEVRNDIDETMNAEYHEDAYSFVLNWTGEKFDTIILDPPYCYDEETEILTEEGWRYFKELTGTETVATLNPATHKLEYQQITDFYNSDYNGEMVKVKSGSIDLMVTPDHDLYVRKLWKSNKFKKVKAKDLDFGCNFKSDCDWDGEEKEFFYLPRVEFDRHNRYGETSADVKAIPMDTWLVFLGWYLSEGCVDHTGTAYRVRIAQTNAEKRPLIENCLDELGYKYMIEANSYTIYNKQLAVYLRQFGKTKEKHIPKEVKSLPKRQLKLLLDTLILGDGCVYRESRFHKKYKKTYKSKRVSYTSYSKQLIDDVHEIALKCGYVCTLFNTKKEITNGVSNGYHLGITNHRKTPILRKKLLSKYVQTEEYKGRIYCVTAPNGLVYVRRNKDACWCGNSYRKSMEFYNGNRASPFRKMKDAIPRILRLDGKVITFGYHSISMGKGRGFAVEKVCLFSHGGAIHDTIATVERKISNV